MNQDAVLEAVYITYSMSTFFLIFFVTYSMILVLVRISPGLGICLLFSLISLTYLLILMLSATYRFLAVALGVLVLALVNSGPYKYRFPGLKSYDPCRNQGPPRIDLYDEDQKVERGELPTGPTPRLLDDRRVLEAWVDRLGRGSKQRPKLVLVAVSGGAYRASFWTTVVLDALARTPELEGFLNHIRLMTGASGGMVGAAYVAALLQDPGSGRYSLPPDATNILEQESGRDSLTPIVQQLIRRDVVLALWPGVQTYDRGRALEDQWRALNLGFKRSAPARRPGGVPPWSSRRWSWRRAVGSSSVTSISTA